MILRDWKRAKTVNLIDYGQVGAGKIIDFLPRGKRSVSVPGSQRTEGLVLVSVCGDSLRDLGITDGDQLICQTKFEKSEVKNGKLVVAALPCLGLVVKFFFQKPFFLHVAGKGRGLRKIELATEGMKGNSALFFHEPAKVAKMVWPG